MTELPEWIAIAVLTISLIITWVRNGRKQAKEWGSFTTEVEHIKNALEDPNQGLGALKKGITDMQTHCATVSGKLGEKAHYFEGEIENLKKK